MDKTTTTTKIAYACKHRDNGGVIVSPETHSELFPTCSLLLLSFLRSSITREKNDSLPFAQTLHSPLPLTQANMENLPWIKNISIWKKVD